MVCPVTCTSSIDLSKMPLGLVETKNIHVCTTMDQCRQMLTCLRAERSMAVFIQRTRPAGVDD